MVARSLPKAPCCSTSRPVSADWLTWLALLAVLVRRRRRSPAGRGSDARAPRRRRSALDVRIVTPAALADMSTTPVGVYYTPSICRLICFHEKKKPVACTTLG